MALNNDWFTEIDERGGSAFSLRLRAKLHEEQTRYQHIEIYQTERYGRLMVIDGYIMLSDFDNFIYHEMISHPVLFSHPEPRRVLIIGGGDCGTLREVLRHPVVESVVQVEIDERVTRLAERFFPGLCEANDDPRACLVFDDGLRWIAEAAPESLDVVIVDSTDPYGPAAGLFGEAFYRDAFRALSPAGLVAQQSESPLYHLHNILQPMHKAMRRAGFADVRSLHFPQPVYPSGWWTATLACKSGEVTPKRLADAEQQPPSTRYYNPAVHQAAFCLPAFVANGLTPEALAEAPGKARE